MAIRRIRAASICALALAICRPLTKSLLLSSWRPSGSRGAARADATAWLLPSRRRAGEGPLRDDVVGRGRLAGGCCQTYKPGGAHPRRALQAAGRDPGEGPSDQTLACLRSNLDKLDLLWAIPDGDLGQMVQSLRSQEVEDGQVIFNQGDDGTCFYIVEQGSFEVYLHSGEEDTLIGKKVADIGPGGGFGEMAVIYDDPRSATVVATSTGLLWAMEGQDFMKMMAAATTVPKQIMNSFRENRQLGGLFWMLPEAEFLQLCKSMYRQDVQAGDVVVAEGDIATRFYVVDSGTFTVSNAESSEEPIHELGPGSSFGELALLYDKPRTATVTATSDAEVWIMERSNFEAAIERLQRRPIMKKTVAFLRSAKMFKGVPDKDLAWLASVMRPQVVAPGEVLVKAGDDVKEIFLLQIGELKSWEPSEYGEKPMEVYKEPGELVHKSSLVEPTWDVTIRSNSDVTLVLWVSKLTLRMMFEGSTDQLYENAESSDSGDWWPFR